MRRLEPCSGRSLPRPAPHLLLRPGHKHNVSPRGSCLPCGTNIDYEVPTGFSENPIAQKCEDTRQTWHERHEQKTSMKRFLGKLHSASSKQ